MYVSRDVDACYVSWGGEDVNICINVYIHICDADVWRHIYLLSCFMCWRPSTHEARQQIYMSGNICIHICIYMYIFTYEYISIYVWTHTLMIVSVNICVYAYICWRTLFVVGWVLHVYICLYIGCVISVYACIYLCMVSYICRYMCKYECIYECIYEWLHIWIHACMHIWMRICIHKRIHIWVYQWCWRVSYVAGVGYRFTRVYVNTQRKIYTYV